MFIFQIHGTKKKRLENEIGAGIYENTNKQLVASGYADVNLLSLKLSKTAKIGLGGMAQGVSKSPGGLAAEGAESSLSGMIGPTLSISNESRNVALSLKAGLLSDFNFAGHIPVSAAFARASVEVKRFEISGYYAWSREPGPIGPFVGDLGVSLSAGIPGVPASAKLGFSERQGKNIYTVGVETPVDDANRVMGGVYANFSSSTLLATTMSISFRF